MSYLVELRAQLAQAFVSCGKAQKAMLRVFTFGLIDCFISRTSLSISHFIMAEAVGLEPTEASSTSAVFKTAAFSPVLPRLLKNLSPIRMNAHLS